MTSAGQDIRQGLCSESVLSGLALAGCELSPRVLVFGSLRRSRRYEKAQVLP